MGNTETAITAPTQSVPLPHSSTMFLFMIVGKKDAPLFEAELQAGIKSTDLSATKDPKKEETHMPNFIIHASLDVVDEAVWKNANMYVNNK